MLAFFYLVFPHQASEYARVRGIPRLFLTANSGARIGMAQSLKNKFKVAFVDEADPSKGFKYIYMDEGACIYMCILEQVV